jgi:hypothetical protein
VSSDTRQQPHLNLGQHAGGGHGDERVVSEVDGPRVQRGEHRAGGDLQALVCSSDGRVSRRRARQHTGLAVANRALQRGHGDVEQHGHAAVQRGVGGDDAGDGGMASCEKVLRRTAVAMGLARALAAGATQLLGCATRHPTTAREAQPLTTVHQ